MVVLKNSISFAWLASSTSMYQDLGRPSTPSFHLYPRFFNSSFKSNGDCSAQMRMVLRLARSSRTARAASSIVPRGIRSSLSRRRGLLGLGGFGRADPVVSDTVDLLGEEREFQLLAHRACQKSAHRVLLPFRLLDQGIQCRAFRALKQGYDPVLFGAWFDSIGRCLGCLRGNGCGLLCARSPGAARVFARLGFSEHIGGCGFSGIGRGIIVRRLGDILDLDRFKAGLGNPQ